MTRTTTNRIDDRALLAQEGRGIYSQRLLMDGAERLGDEELLAAILHRGSAVNSAIGLAHELLTRFNGFAGLLRAPRDEILAVPGMGPARWAMLQATRELFRRSLLAEIECGSLLNSPAAVREFLTIWLRDKPFEVFVVLFLDTRNQLIAAEEMFRGSLSQTAVYPRVIVRRCLELNAGAVIFAHQHPSGLAEPSHADRVLTDALKSALIHLEIRVLDHIIVAGNKTLSFAEQGHL